MMFEESAAYPEENECDYRIEWDDRKLAVGTDEHEGSGSVLYTDYDQAWESWNYKKKKDRYIYSGLKMIQIYPDGSEVVRFTA